MQTTLGGDRLGSGNKQNLSFRNYERSSHDLGFVWRSSMSSGTLVPFLSKVALPGDTWDIKLDCDVLTLPTIGPLFGSYKVQLDVFEIPMRLYNAKLHMNKLGIGMDMSKILLPQIEMLAYNPRPTSEPVVTDNSQINASCLMKYLGLSGLGFPVGTNNPAKRYFNAVPLLAYWDIYKNYYSNKQEEIGYHIHTTDQNFDAAQTPINGELFDSYGAYKGNCTTSLIEFNTGDRLDIYFNSWAKEPDPTTVYINKTGPVNLTVAASFESTYYNESLSRLECYNFLAAEDGNAFAVTSTPSTPVGSTRYFFGLQQFDLANIDTMREKILQHAGSDAYIIKSTEIAPYNAMLQLVTKGAQPAYSCVYSQESLAIKTYQSDLFNNWINTEWIDGAGGISELTAIDTTSGEFTIDALNIASKVYDMLNRIAVSGGTYDDWLEAVYTHERVRGVESPVYCGSLIKELAFEEVVSLAETSSTQKGDKPLGTLAGRGRLTNKNKGGDIKIRVNEPSYIMGIVSITPRVDYSQGNEWDLNLKTYDDFHKPALDGIGFQDLITEQLLYSDTEFASDSGNVTQYSLGKQPAWINYMSSVNKTFGSFAETDNSMFMTLNRRYERKNISGNTGRLKDGTTYIDPTKFNNIFADVALDSQNFWCQIACNITARRKMSAKIIPNL